MDEMVDIMQTRLESILAPNTMEKSKLDLSTIPMNS